MFEITIVLSRPGHPNRPNWGMTGKVLPHCGTVGCACPHKKNSCYFDPKKMTDRREFARILMDEKGVAYNDKN